MLKLLKEKNSLNIISDQVGTPTWAVSQAKLLWRLLDKPEIKGTLHWSDAGVASWYDFAVVIQEEALNLGLLKKTIPVIPIVTEDYPLPAKRPAYSVLDKSNTIVQTGMAPTHWRVNLRIMLKELADA